MFYEDFLILDNEQYNLLNKQYEKQTKQNTNPEQVFFKLCSLSTKCQMCASQYNPKIQQALFIAKNTLNKLEGNMQTLFHFNKQKEDITTSDIFTFILDLIALLEDYDNLQTSNNKTFNLQLKRDKQDLFFVLNEIIASLKASNLHIFKFM